MVCCDFRKLGVVGVELTRRRLGEARALFFSFIFSHTCLVAKNSGAVYNMFN